MPDDTTRRSKDSIDMEWRQFEGRVAALYETLGYRVVTNSSVAGQQIDTIATKVIEGLGLVTVVVECKYLSRGSVSNQDVFDFINYVKVLRDTGNVTRGVIVTNRTFSKDAKLAAYGNGSIELTTVNALEQQAFQSQPVYERYIEKYESEEIFQNYVPLRAKRVDGLPRKVNHTDAGQPIADIGAAIQGWINAGNVRLVTILGDFGSGKSTLLRRLKYELAKLYVSGRSRLKPVLIELRDYSRYRSIDALLAHAILENFHSPIPLPVFKRGLREGHFLMLLDGFDEMAARADRARRKLNLVALSRLLEGNSKGLLTCRPAYFVTQNEYNETARQITRQLAPIELSRATGTNTSAQRMVKEVEQLHDHLYQKFAQPDSLNVVLSSEAIAVELESLSIEQIQTFLSKHNSDFLKQCNCGWEEVLSFLQSVYDLSDLMSRPILLHMITDTVLSGNLNVGSSGVAFGPSTLYDLYTSLHLDRDWNKGATRHLVPKSLRKLFAQSIALAMFDKGVLEVTYDDIISVIHTEASASEALRDILIEVQANEVATDVQLCTFLTRHGDGLFRFSHKSFMEFFVALHLKQQLQAGIRDSRISLMLPREVLYFLGGFSAVEPDVRHKLAEWYESKDAKPAEAAPFRRNLAGALLYCGSNLIDLTLRGTNLSSIDITKTNMLNSSFTKIYLDNVTWRGVRSTNCEFDDVVFENSEVNNWALIDCKLNMQISNCDMVDVNARDCSLSLFGRNGSCIAAAMTNTRTAFSGILVVSECKFTGGILTLSSADSSSISFLDNILINTTVTSKAGMDSSVQITNMRMRACDIVGMTMSDTTYRQLKLENCRGFVVMTGALGDDNLKRKGFSRVGDLFQITQRAVLARPAELRQMIRKVLGEIFGVLFDDYRESCVQYSRSRRVAE